NQSARILGDPAARTTQGVEGWLAASILGREMGMAAMISATAAMALGLDADWWENAKAGPGVGGRWLSIPTGDGGYIPTLPTTGALALYARLATGSTSLADANTDPKTRFDMMTRFFEGR